MLVCFNLGSYLVFMCLPKVGRKTDNETKQTEGPGFDPQKGYYFWIQATNCDKFLCETGLCEIFPTTTRLCDSYFDDKHDCAKIFV